MHHEVLGLGRQTTVASVGAIVDEGNRVVLASAESHINHVAMGQSIEHGVVILRLDAAAECHAAKVEQNRVSGGRRQRCAWTL